MTCFHSIVSTIENKKIPKSLVIKIGRQNMSLVVTKHLLQRARKVFRLQGLLIREQSQQHSALPWMASFFRCKFIYGGKTTKSIPRVSFPDGFLVSANLKHYSNEEESLKMMEHIIIPYVKNQRKILKLDAEYPAMLIMDVF